MGGMMEKPLQSLKHEDKEKVCPDCGSLELDYVGGERICKKCGLVID
jgi:hypothetical protein